MDSSPLDYIAQECMELTENFSAANETDKDYHVKVDNHISKVYSAGAPIRDFEKSLEWVNVSKPISLAEHCKDKVVVLDFWTYCCINCYHVLPDLAHIEKTFSVEDGLVVIGVHCAKFTNEKETENILAAVKRYDIKHPVVNDAECSTWEALGIRCWPTLLILGPGNIPLFIITGEGCREELVLYVQGALRHFSSKLSKQTLPIEVNAHIQATAQTILRYPGKVALNPFCRGQAEEPFLAISDTGNHRIILTDCTGLILKIIGASRPGFKDGNLTEAMFHSPQGLCWLSSSVLVVCDTDNHMVRTVHLDDGTVEVLAGTGKQASHGDNGGKCLGLQALSSPWDILLFTTADMDMSVRTVLPPLPNADKQGNNNVTKEKEKNNDKRRVLLVACAGSHQIWAIFLETTIWWKYKTYSEGTCVCIVGSGKEAARNSVYPNTAAFAQPSGLALKSGNSPELFIADSESSSIRRLFLGTGQVAAVAGGDRNPVNLFAYGDKDDVSFDAKFQHPLGLTYCEGTKTLYVTDTYNHKIKKVDVLSHRVTTLKCVKTETTESTKFNEPSGISITNDGKYLYVADTNNHDIKIINIAKMSSQNFRIHYTGTKFQEPDNLIIYKNDLFVNRKCGSLLILFHTHLEPTESRNIKETPGAPQCWNLCIRDQSSKDVTHEDFEYVNGSHKGTQLPGRIEMKLKKRTDKTHYRMYLSIDLALCEESVCFTHSFVVRSMILVRDSVKPIESYRMTCKVNTINVKPHKI